MFEGTSLDTTCQMPLVTVTSLFTEGSTSPGSFLPRRLGFADASDSDAGAGSASEPGGLQGATRHLKECGQTTSYPGGAQEPANKMLHLPASPPQCAFGVSGLPLTPLSSASRSPAADLIPQKAPEPPLSKKMHMDSCINCSADSELLLTLSILGPFPNQEYSLDFSGAHLPREFFF